ncbi:unnamed protein product [Anisakis simplex]|uniref:Uncharacterized protein n=1 Tax=Anisakis simplex TaxID=6269 RepID=A0A0M3JKU3_ANISI|nr:unnamed protein product [Anisakis simplex]
MYTNRLLQNPIPLLQRSAGVATGPQGPTRLKWNDNWPARLASGMASQMAKTMQENGPQYPAGQSNRATTAGRDSRVQRLLRISSSDGPSQHRKTTLAIHTYNCRSLAGRTGLTHLN